MFLLETLRRREQCLWKNHTCMTSTNIMFFKQWKQHCQRPCNTKRLQYEFRRDKQAYLEMHKLWLILTSNLWYFTSTSSLERQETQNFPFPPLVLWVLGGKIEDACFFAGALSQLLRADLTMFPLIMMRTITNGF